MKDLLPDIFYIELKGNSSRQFIWKYVIWNNRTKKILKIIPLGHFTGLEDVMKKLEETNLQTILNNCPDTDYTEPKNMDKTTLFLIYL
jgi:hypothetical protein